MLFFLFTDEAILQRPHPEDATGGTEGTDSAETREGLFQIRMFPSDIDSFLHKQRMPQADLRKTEITRMPTHGLSGTHSKYLSQTGS